MTVRSIFAKTDIGKDNEVRKTLLDGSYRPTDYIVGFVARAAAFILFLVVDYAEKQYFVYPSRQKLLYVERQCVRRKAEYSFHRRYFLLDVFALDHEIRINEFRYVDAYIGMFVSCFSVRSVLSKTFHTILSLFCFPLFFLSPPTVCRREVRRTDS